MAMLGVASQGNPSLKTLSYASDLKARTLADCTYFAFTSLDI